MFVVTVGNQLVTQSSKKARFVKKTDTQYYKVQSNCPYFVFHSKTPRNFSTRNKCSNHLLVCPATACEIPVWKYNLPAHFRSADQLFQPN